jgi:putative peptide zinc metalloprotease protein
MLDTARVTSDKALARLREELILEPGPSMQGAPTWTLYDPTTGKFYRIGWLEFEILAHWHLRRPELIADHISQHTTLRPDPVDVEHFVKFLQAAELLRVTGAEAIGRFVQRKAGRRQAWYKWLVHHYLFVRIPLVRPDGFLTAALPYVQWVYTRAFLIVTLLCGLTGLYLALRQWDVFAASLPWFFSLEGAALAGLALVASKLLHECGHGFTAKRFGCRIPTMGVALLVMAPVLYTDTSAAWRLRERSKRLAIGSAGVAAECCLAAYALLAWSFLPDGIFRSIVFIWATTTWILTVAVNMSPFMRFDGYYLFSDLIEVPNLQERSFALARHTMREFLFGFGDAPPELWSPRMRRILVTYAFTTWLYRFTLFLGIAFVVYHMFFKALGIVLFAIEIWWFILQPILRELREWMKRPQSP